jgi:hypothetical protein
MLRDAHAHLSESCRGADDEGTRSDFASVGEEDYVVASCRDPVYLHQTIVIATLAAKSSANTPKNAR